MDTVVDSCAKQATAAAGIVPVGGFDDDAFDSLLTVSTVAPGGLGGARECDVLPGALEAILVDVRRERMRREGPVSTLSS
jgi:hypothetical protein